MGRLTSFLVGLTLGVAGSLTIPYLLPQEPENTEISSTFSNNKTESSEDLSKKINGAYSIKALHIDLGKIKLNNNLDIEDSLITSYASDIGGYSWKIPIRASDYFKYKMLDHRDKLPFEYVNYVTYTDPTIKTAAENLTKRSKSKEESAQYLLDFVHNQLYDKTIEEKINYAKYPLETLVERNGDCEDLSILGAALMKAIDIDVALIYYQGDPNKNGHVALGINGDFSGTYYQNEGKKYFYAEPTGTDWPEKRANWKIGDIPEEYKDEKAAIYIVE